MVRMAAGGPGLGRKCEPRRLPQADTVLWDVGMVRFRQEIRIE